jgi:putative addiction module killer protein
MLPSSRAFRIEEYIRADGSNPYRAWFDGLDPHAAAKIASAMARLAIGNTSNVKWFSGIGEVRVDFGPGYRVYLVQDGRDLIVLFGGGIKKRQEADITRALVLKEEYKARKAARVLRKND